MSPSLISASATLPTQATQSAEYKQVTVLFADVVHSMDIAAAVGAEITTGVSKETTYETAQAISRCCAKRDVAVSQKLVSEIVVSQRVLFPL